MKSLAYMSLVHPILEYEALCWDPIQGRSDTLVRLRAKESG